jgi:hypothetical protein
MLLLFWRTVSATILGPAFRFDAVVTLTSLRSAPVQIAPQLSARHTIAPRVAARIRLRPE